jgi:hypothetical protein
MRYRTMFHGFAACLLLASGQATALAEEADFAMVEKQFQPEIQPLLERYCRDCHNPDLAEADLDLTVFQKWDDVRRQAPAWQKIDAMLESGQMPPKDAPQPSPAERMQLNRWVREFITLQARATAGDPGRVVLRRLSNAEYTYTLRDLTGIDELDPAREFPVDGAAGEGFSNTGNALVMSPALVTKYLDAAKGVADHAVLLPNGFRFAPSTTRRDWTNEAVADIRAFYSQITNAQGGDRVNLQGVEFDTNAGGRLPVAEYLAATLAEREALQSGKKSIETVARERKLNAKYLGLLWQGLTGTESSFLLEQVRQRWRIAKPEDATALTELVAAWQKELWKFSTVGHIGKVGGPKRWLEPVDPLLTKQEIRYKLPAAAAAPATTIYLVASDSGDGREHDFVVWDAPRLVAPGVPDILLRDVRRVSGQLAARRSEVLAATSSYLAAADEAGAAMTPVNVGALADKHHLDAELLASWLDYLGIGSASAVQLEGYLQEKITGVGEYKFINGWGKADTPSLLANSSDQHVRVPGNIKPHGVVVHPTPTLRTVVGWRSPISGLVDVEAEVAHAHPECGNGVTWSLELRRGVTRRRLATGIAHGAQGVKAGPFPQLAVREGDILTLAVGPRDGNHSCDLTAIDLRIAAQQQTWDLAADVSPEVLAGNPHRDRFGNKEVWHFYTEPDKGTDLDAVIPPGSLLARWLAAADSNTRRTLAVELQTLLTAAAPNDKQSADAALYEQLTSLGGPLFRKLLPKLTAEGAAQGTLGDGDEAATAWGLDPALFGKHPDGSAVAAGSLCLQAPQTVEIHLPADLVAGRELITTVTLHPRSREGSVQAQVVGSKPAQGEGLLPTGATVANANGPWTADNQRVAFGTPILLNAGSEAEQRIRVAFDDFRNLFPPALCYTKIVPVDEVVTLTLFYREDDHLGRLMLDDAQQAHLDRLWAELRFISEDALTLVDAYAQLMEYATQDADPKVFEPLREPIQARAAQFRQQLLASEPKHLEALLAFAQRAYRRPLSAAEQQSLENLYASLRAEEMSHDEAFRLTLSRVLVAPAFLYRVEKPVAGTEQGPVSDWELASRLSYFLWSSLPDEELRRLAAAGKLRDPEVLAAQAQRMLRSAKTRRLATEFACQWLQIYDFDQLDEKSEQHFPTFATLRGAMYEESIRFWTELFQNGGSVDDILAADFTYLNADLAAHYGIEGVAGAEWVRSDGMRKQARGGILGQATTLAKQSGASRTSPILRGNWVSEVLLGERLPRPPKGIPPLPDDEAATDGLTVRELVEKHSSDEKCMVCHRRIDPLGFALEGFDAIGRRRTKDASDRPLDVRATTIDGVEVNDLEGLRTYLLTTRREAFVRQFSKKLLGYSLGRSVQLSDELLLAEMQNRLKTENRLASLIDVIVRSPQFREIRGRETAYDE